MPKKPAKFRGNPKNPRKITDKKLVMLKKAMDRFGDLGGIVVNQRTGQLVSGHQRVSAAQLDDSAVTITREHKTPTGSGTVAEGYVTVGEERFGYRLVDMDEPTALAAGLAANKNAGEFDMPMLADQFRELDGWDIDKDLTMFGVNERAFAMDQQPDAEAPNDLSEKSDEPNRCPSCGHEWMGNSKGG